MERKNKRRAVHLPGGQLRKAIEDCFQEWIERKHGGMNYYLTQILTGHGCFNSFLRRINKAESEICSHCEEGRVDKVEHTLSRCEEWNIQRECMKERLACEVNLTNVLKALCEG